jgi:hypothetical protein
MKVAFSAELLLLLMSITIVLRAQSPLLIMSLSSQSVVCFFLVRHLDVVEELAAALTGFMAIVLLFFLYFIVT